MKFQRPKPTLYSIKGGELSLSGTALVEIIRAVLDKGVPFRFQARGFSMTPFIRNGDVITVSPLHGSTPGIGRVVALIQPGTGKLLVHRIIGKRREYFLIKGDNNPGADGLIPKVNILGSVIKNERNGKKVFIGIGPERFLIALLTRLGLLFPVLLLARRLIQPIMRVLRI